MSDAIDRWGQLRVQFQENGLRHLGARERDNSNPDCSRTGEKRRHSSIVNRQR
jgi:hypothetical protein